MLLKTLIPAFCLVLSACATQAVINKFELSGSVSAGLPAIDLSTGIYEVAVQDGVTYQDVVDSLKSLSEANNFVNPANFPIGEHIKQRGIDPRGIKDVRSFCNLSLGTDIMLDHPEFLVFVPCRIAIYEKPDANHRLKLFIGLARPTFDLQSIKAPTPRAQAAAVALETTLLAIIAKASRGDF
jgi:uncharacterized protein (DUF302 family)